MHSLRHTAIVLNGYNARASLGGYCMRRRNISALLIAILFLGACSNLKNTKVTAENKREIMSRISQGNEITDEERHLLVEYSVRYNLSSVLKGQGADLPTGKTVGQMIEEQRKWDAEHPQSGNAQP
jgi:hypothetical protein